MKTRLALAAIFLSGLAAHCGGEQPQPATPPTSTEAPDGAPPEGDGSAPSPATAASAAPAESAAPAPGASAAAPPAAPKPAGPGDWETWSHDQKLEYMKAYVMPKMGDAFHDFDAKRYAEPKCALCHGDGVKDGSFTMPNPELPKLDVTPAGIKKLHSDPKKKAVLEFMSKTVVPNVAQLLGMQPYDMKTKQGFGCLACHTKKETGSAAAKKKTPAAP
jgi:hypothetical protein